MNEIDVNHVLSQIRSLQAQTQASAAGRANAAAGTQSSGFASMLKSAIGEVNSSQQTAQNLQQSFAMGDSNVELSSVMLATAKAQVQFKAMSEVRNRLVAAYQDIMNMPI